MSITQAIEWRYDSDGRSYPVLRITSEGCHDVGRTLATLAHGNVEHGDVAYKAARALNRTEVGRATLAYLRSHGGPALGPHDCESCGEGNHAECEHDPYDGLVCRCYEADERAHKREAMP